MHFILLLSWINGALQTEKIEHSLPQMPTFDPFQSKLSKILITEGEKLAER